MTAPPPVVAPNFRLPEPAGGRVLVPEGAGWRPLAEPLAGTGAPSLLFALPGHLRSSFWEMLQQVGMEGFNGFAAEVSKFLAFKQLAPPAQAAFELVLHGADGNLDPRDLWAVVNLGDDAVLVELPGVRVRLCAGEGLQVPRELTANVVPPEGDETEPDVLLLIRRPPG